MDEKKRIIKLYNKIILLHSNDSHKLTRTCLALEREVFLDGYYFAFSMNYCLYCKKCNIDNGFECSFPEKVRPCEQSFGINMYETVRKKGLPINVLQSKEDTENRYGLVFVD